MGKQEPCGLKWPLTGTPPNDIEFTGEKEGAPATDAESGAMSCWAAVAATR